ncbi:MAG: DEAD/DEAH box helicase [Bdellovibrionales bacterium]
MSHTTFDTFGLPAKLLHALTRMQFTTPTPIQDQAIPFALEGRDILGSAQTGTGKTGAFGIPLIAGLMEHPEATALIMTPTRELAGQVLAAMEPMIPVADIRTALLIGGESMPKQLNQLQHRPRLVVGTPGRINDHLERGSLKLNNVRYLVLDETDRMLDMGFGVQIERILKHVPKERQTLLFSATLPSNIVKLSGKYMRDPVRIAVGSTTTPLEKIKQEMISVTDAEKYVKLIEQIKARKGSIIIFAKTKWGTQKLSDRLNKDGHRSDAIHGNLQQRRRDRVIQNFRDERYRILVATDVAARGLDIPHIAHVINYDVPMAPEDYIHRIGRTARADAEGQAISFVTSADGARWRAIQRLIGGEAANSPAPRGERSHNRSGDGKRKPFWKRDGDKPRGERPYGARSHGDNPPSERPHGDRPRSDKPHSDRPRSDRPRSSDRPREDAPREERSYGRYQPSHKPHAYKPRGERPEGDRPRSSDRPRDDKPREDRGHTEHSRSDKPRGAQAYGKYQPSHKPHAYKPRGERPEGDRPRSSDRPRDDKPREDRVPTEHSRSDKPRGAQAHSDRPQGNKHRNERPFGAKFHKGGKSYVHKQAHKAS